MIYHITSRGAWQRATERGQYSAPSLKTEGFIHCSTREQVLGVANDFYREQDDLRLLCIDETLLQADLFWEAAAHPDPEAASSPTEAQLFPHIYGCLNLDAVAAVLDLPKSAAGFSLPRGLP